MHNRRYYVALVATLTAWGLAAVTRSPEVTGLLWALTVILWSIAPPYRA